MTTFVAPRSKSPSLVLQVVAATFGGLLLFVLGVAIWTFGYSLWYAGRIFPGVSMAGVDLSGLPVSQAAARLEQAVSYPQTGKIVFRDGEKLWIATPAELGMRLDTSTSAQQAYRLGRSQGLFGNLNTQIQSMQRGVDTSPVLVFDQRGDRHEFVVGGSWRNQYRQVNTDPRWRMANGFNTACRY